MKKLPFCYPPIVDSFSGSAGVIGIMMLDERYKPLIFANNYLITYNRNISAPGFNWAYYNDDYSIDIDIRMVALEKGVIETIIDSIDNNFYVHILLDHYYLECSEFYGINHMLHDSATILGYDEVDKYFVVGDNFRNGKYTIEKVSFNNVLEARKDIPEGNFDRLQVLSTPDFVLDKEMLLCLLQGYVDETCYFSDEHVNQKNMQNIKEDDILYGASIYQILIEQVEKIKYGINDIRPFHVLYNHMSLYNYLFDVLINFKEELREKGCMELANSLIGTSKRLRLSYLKLYMSWSEHLYTKICNDINEIKEKEFKLIQILLDVVKRMGVI